MMMIIIIMESHKLKVKLGLPPTMKVKIISHPIQGQSILLSNILNCFALYVNLKCCYCIFFLHLQNFLTIYVIYKSFEAIVGKHCKQVVQWL